MILPCDLNKVAQAPVGSLLRFELLTLEEGTEVQARANAVLSGLRKSVKPLVRDVSSIQNLLSYQLISGAISAKDTPLD
jgi:allophanate hydrolase